MISPQQLRWLGLFTLFGFGGLGLLIIEWSDGPRFSEMIRGDFLFWEQAGIGLGFGTLFAFAGWGIIQLPFMEPVEKKYRTLIGSIRIGWADIIFVSLCAGIGEEILFRGGIQPHLGVWPTAILFVAIHGYLNPKDWRISIYGVFMTVAIGIIGLLYDRVGAISAFAAHTMIDVVLLRAMTRAFEKKDGETPEEDEGSY